MRLTFRTKLLASHLGLAAAIVLLVMGVLDASLTSDLERQLDERLLQQAHGAAHWVDAGRHPAHIAGRLASVVNARITIVDKEGKLAGDSDAGGAHGSLAEMPEVEAARAGKVGRATRPAKKGDPLLFHYIAVRTESGMVLRLGVPLSGIDATLKAMQRRLLMGSALGIAAALALGFLASRFAARPLRDMMQSARRIAQGDYAIEAPSAPDEFGDLSRSLASLAAQLKAHIGELTAERDRLTAIVAGMQEGVLVAGPGRRIEVANPSAARILGAEGDVTGSRLEDVLRDPGLRALVARAQETGAISEAEIDGRAEGGRAIAMYVRPLGERDGVVAVLRDMTQIRRLETMRRDFVANASHELRTPVTAIQGYSETLLSGSPDEATRRRFLETIHRHARRLGALLEGLLRLSELEARDGERPTLEAVHIGSIAAQIAESSRARDARVRITTACDARAIARGDPIAIEQILENLVDNAIKYGRADGHVELLAEREANRVIVRVRDDGPGIERQHLGRLFERFYRVDPSRSRERGGSGLGLSIVKHLVEWLGGTISVESQLGSGSTFLVELPAADEAAPA
jgi:two-component system, OmpR family, phosphate regulon sensor histidine kinase PhoR